MCVRYGTGCLNLCTCMLIQYIKLSEAIVHMLHCTSNSSFLLLVVRGVPSLILA